MSVWLNATDVAAEVGLRWSLTVGAQQRGKAPNPTLSSNEPSVRGEVSTVPIDTTQCNYYERTPDSQPVVRSTIEESLRNVSRRRLSAVFLQRGYVVLPATNSTVLKLGPCRSSGLVAASAVPGRSASQSLFGPTRYNCLEEIQLFVTAVPLTQLTPHDLLGSTSSYSRRTFDLGLTGASTTTNDDFAAPGAWSQSTSGRCPGCRLLGGATGPQGCPSIKVTVALQKDTFGVTESLVRSEGLVKFGPALLASCLSLAAVVLMLYNVVGDSARTRSQFIDWSRTITTTAKAEPFSTAAGDKCLAHSALVSDDNVAASPGSFTVYADPDSVGTAVLCVTTRDHGVVEVRVEITADKTVRVSHSFGDAATKPGAESSAEYGSMIQAIKQLAQGALPGAPWAILTALVTTGVKKRSMTARSTISMISDPNSWRSTNTQSYPNPVFVGDDSYIQIKPEAELREPLLPVGHE